MTTKSSHVTIDHDEIREWAELRCGRPSMVKGTGTGTGASEHAGILRIDFPGYSGRGTLEPISWDEFFEKFEESKLALVYSAHAHGHRSNFNKLIARETVDLETGEKLGPSRHRRKQAEASSQRSAKRATVSTSRKATPRRTARSAPAASGERRVTRSEAARKVKATARKPAGRSTQRAGARQGPERRGTSRGTRSRGR